MEEACSVAELHILQLEVTSRGILCKIFTNNERHTIAFTSLISSITHSAVERGRKMLLFELCNSCPKILHL